MATRSRSARRVLTPFSLAFLDIMSCGLGAVILVFLLIKHADERTSQNLGDVQLDIEAQYQQAEDLDARKEDILQEIQAQERELRTIQTQTRSIRAETETIETRNESLIQQVEQTQTEIAEAERQSANAALEIEEEGYRNYLVGLRVEGRRIVILLDSSASMLAKDIVDIIRLRNSPARQKENAPKWRWAKNILQWMTARLPTQSQVRIMTFSTETTDHSARQRWMNVRSTDDLSDALSSAMRTDPSNGTNLEQAFDAVTSLRPAPDALYIITDGLPTLHGEIGTFDLDNITSCYRSRSNTVTPKCRSEFFSRALKKIYRNSPDLKVNVVLLPIEGDPAAALGYWMLARQNGGTLLTPAENWP